MTNAQIILSEQIRLMDEGIISGTGMFMVVELDDGTKMQQEIPEDIHTFQRWKALGYQVRKGEHAIAKFPIWKHTEKQIQSDDGESQVKASDFMKMSAFFKMSQVDPIQKED